MVQINMTEVAGFNPQQVIQYCNKLSALPSLILFFLLANLIFVIVMSALSKNKAIVFKIWIITFIVTLLFLIMILLLPNGVQQIADFFK